MGMVLNGLSVEGVCDLCADLAFAFVAGNSNVAEAVYASSYVADAMAAVYAEGGDRVEEKEAVLKLLSKVSDVSGKGAEWVEGLVKDSGDDELLNLLADM